MDQSSPLRIGAVRYLNARPLTYRLSELAPEAELVLDVPSRLADALRAGRLDVGLIPSVEYFRAGCYSIVPGIAIAARGPVRSVKLYSRCALDEIGTLALDVGSRTSAALAQIWLARAYGVRPDVEPLPLGVPPEATTADAVLAIGDRGMFPAPAGVFRHEVDLAEAWLELTGLPFVFAIWAVAPDVDLGAVEAAFHQAKREGLAAVHAIARQATVELGLPFEDCLRYLTCNICYDLTEPELRGLNLFYRWARELELVPDGVELKFYDRANLAEVSSG